MLLILSAVSAFVILAAGAIWIGIGLFGGR
jgi:hypothetical protein